jgi:transmembrane sensor
MEKEIQEIIIRVFEGNASEEDRKFLLEWVQLNKENQKELEQAEGLWNALAIISNREKFEPKKGYKEFIKELNKIEQIPPAAIQKRKISYFLQIAASLLLIMGSYLIWKSLQPVKEEIAFFELFTPKGSHTQVTLIDGTKIWLNAESKLRYPNKFGGKTRTVFLEGEAFFEVQKDPAKPFIVQTAALNVKAFGTSFNVKAFPNEGSVETTLVNGVVVVEGNQGRATFSSVKLLPNQRVTFVKTTGKLFLNDQEKILLKKVNADVHVTERQKESIIVTEKVNTELYTSWIDNQLIFDNETLESIANKLERRYGANIVFRNERMKTYRFSGKFPEISIERALNALQFASPFEYKIKQDTIFIK